MCQIVSAHETIQVCVCPQAMSAREELMGERAVACLAHSTREHTRRIVQKWRETAACERNQRCVRRYLPWFHTVVDCFTVRMHCMHVDHCMHVTQLPLTLDDVLLS